MHSKQLHSQYRDRFSWASGGFWNRIKYTESMNTPRYLERPQTPQRWISIATTAICTRGVWTGFQPQQEHDWDLDRAIDMIVPASSAWTQNSVAMFRSLLCAANRSLLTLPSRKDIFVRSQFLLLLVNRKSLSDNYDPSPSLISGLSQLFTVCRNSPCECQNCFRGLG